MLLDKIKDLWWIFGALCGLIGFGGGVLIKYNAYYLGEQASVAALNTNSLGLDNVVSRLSLIDGRLVSIDNKIVGQGYLDSNVAGKLSDLADHVHALDGRADGDRQMLNDFLDTQRKNTQQILLLLEPKAPPRK